MNLSNGATLCCSLLQALIVFHAIGGAESFNTISKDQVGNRFVVSSLSSNTKKHHSLNAVVDGHDSDKLNCKDNSSVSDLTRRRGGRILFQSMLLGALPWELSNQAARADDESLFVLGKVNLPPGVEEPGSGEAGSSDAPPAKPALYVTVRPNRPDNVPRAILDGSRGKPPPVLAARYESPVFPFEFGLGQKDLTSEGMGNEDGGYWWSSDDLIVSARWDSDGVAATRSPEDLVGRNLFKKGTTEGFVLDLQGRGSFGKFATKKN